ncbi:hypothetical protein BdWA1_002082 [Babesia duncani]|uniref:Uncharacterized protein n=1 Tax=Babesia duncani TaxID=323732 RepID=A0AAD9PL56_9APIC|nr:hypothetical protein BdWA1_002082 [Babesia duncani]
MHIYKGCHFVIFLTALYNINLVAFSKAIEYPKIPNEDSLKKLIERWCDTAADQNKKSVQVACKLFKERIPNRNRLFSHLHNHLDRAEVIGLVPKCMCRYITCTIMPCFSKYHSESIGLFESVDCLSEIITMNIFKLLPLIHLCGATTLDEITKNGYPQDALLEASNVLADEYGYSSETVANALEHCASNHQANRLACWVNAIYRLHVAERHKTAICLYDYINATAVTCIFACGDHYHPKCLECIGQEIPDMITCMSKEPIDIDGTVDNPENILKETTELVTEYIQSPESVSFAKRAKVAKGLSYCLEQGLVTPSELVDCISRIFLGGGLIANVQVRRCLGDYFNCTREVCIKSYIKERSIEATRCLGKCIPGFATCIARSWPAPPVLREF